MMKAVILAAGKGTRMGGLTSELPKPMLRVQGKPILELILQGLMEAGVRDFFIVTGFRAEVIEGHFGDGKKWGARIQYGRQDGAGRHGQSAGSGKGICRRRRFCPDLRRYSGPAANLPGHAAALCRGNFFRPGHLHGKRGRDQRRDSSFSTTPFACAA